MLARRSLSSSELFRTVRNSSEELERKRKSLDCAPHTFPALSGGVGPDLKPRTRTKSVRPRRAAKAWECLRGPVRALPSSSELFRTLPNSLEEFGRARKSSNWAPQAFPGVGLDLKPRTSCCGQGQALSGPAPPLRPGTPRVQFCTLIGPPGVQFCTVFGISRVQFCAVFGNPGVQFCTVFGTPGVCFARYSEFVLHGIWNPRSSVLHGNWNPLAQFYTVFGTLPEPVTARRSALVLSIPWAWQLI